MQLTNAEQSAAIKKYTRIIHHVGRAYRWLGDSYDDAVIEAMCAVVRGVETYDNRVECTIDTYVGTCVRNAFRGYVKANRTGQEGFEGQCIAFSDLFPDGQLPTDCAPDDGDIETIEGFFITDDVNDRIRKANLSPREGRTIAMSLEGYTLAEIGRAEGISRERVRQIYGRVVEKMRGDITK
jgi:RNA polymerase sigma factor (sigma-70 family)